MNCSRRALLRTTPAVVVGLAGCSGGGSDDSGSENIDVGDQQTERPDSDNDGVPDLRDDYPNDSTRSQRVTTISDERNIEEDGYYYYSINFAQSTTIEYEFVVRQGTEIDVILFDESEFSHYENGERSRYYTGLSALNSVGDSATGQVGTGSYRLVFDNTNYGEAAPPTNFDNDVVNVEFSIEAYR